MDQKLILIPPSVSFQILVRYVRRILIVISVFGDAMYPSVSKYFSVLTFSHNLICLTQNYVSIIYSVYNFIIRTILNIAYFSYILQ